MFLLARLAGVARRTLPLRCGILFGTCFGIEFKLGLLFVFACFGLLVLASLTVQATRPVVDCCVLACVVGARRAL